MFINFNNKNLSDTKGMLTGSPMAHDELEHIISGLVGTGLRWAELA